MRSAGGEPGAGAGDPPTRDELDALVLLHMANLAEQARAADGSPGRWLARVRDLAELLLDAQAIEPPLFIAQLATLSEADESLARRAYLDALSEENDEARTSALSLAAAGCPVVPEPCVWLAHLSARRGDGRSARSWTGQARARLGALGTSWDKRLTFEEWLAVIDALERPADLDLARDSAAVTHPRALFEVVVRPATAQAPGRVAA